MLDQNSIITGWLWKEESCTPEGNCDELELTIRGDLLWPGSHYRIRILGEERAELDFPVIGDLDGGPDNLLLSDTGVALEHDVDIIIGVVADDTPTDPRPEIVSVEPVPISWNSCRIFDMPECFIQPHQRIRVTFSDQMGFVYFVPHPTWGFNFAFSQDEWQGSPVTVIESDSIKGLEPGKEY